MTSEHISTDRILDYLYHELEPDADAAVFAHISACETCRAEYEAELRLSAALKGAPLARTRELPGAVKAQIWQHVRNAPAPSRWRLFFRPLVAFPVAAALALGVFFTVESTAPPAHPGVDARAYFDLHDAVARQESPLTDRSAPILNAVEASDVQLGDEPSR